jgi:hypothetical protein
MGEETTHLLSPNQAGSFKPETAAFKARLNQQQV